MGTEGNENEPVNLIDEPISSPEAAEEEPIEQVMSTEVPDSGTTESSEPTTEGEDQERFEETTKFEEEIKQKPPKRQKASQKKSVKAESKLLSNLQTEMKRYSSGSKKTDLTIIGIQRKIKDLDKKTDTKHHQIVRDMQKQVKELRREIDRIDRSMRSTNRKQTKKLVGGKKGKSKSIKKKSRNH